jgi:hypothetical protein
MLSSVKSPVSMDKGGLGLEPSWLRRRSSASIEAVFIARISRTLGMVA